MSVFRAVCTLWVVAAGMPSFAGSAVVVADRDATLIEDPNGALANGAGPLLFAGRTNAPDNSVRRALLRFDLATVRAERMPVPASLVGVAVVLANATSSNVAPREYRLHRLLADWGEGVSASPGGAGAPATQSDATWLHTFYPNVFWLHNGAQFDGEPSARLVIAGAGVYRFEGDGLLRDLRRWLREPEQNFGWILIGDETHPQTARAFASREFPEPNFRPALELTFAPAP